MTDPVFSISFFFFCFFQMLEGRLHNSIQVRLFFWLFLFQCKICSIQIRQFLELQITSLRSHFQYKFAAAKDLRRYVSRELFWVQFWKCLQSLLCCNDFRSFSWFFESSSEMLPISTLMQRFENFSWFFWVQFWKLCLPSVTLMQRFEKFLMISLSSVLKILLVIGTLMQRFDKIVMTFLSPVLKILLAIGTLMQRFEKFLMTYVVQFWQSVLCCNDLRSFSWFFESSSENACNRFFAATIWEVSIEFLVQFWKCSQSVLRCEHLKSLSWILSPFLKRRAIQYLAAKKLRSFSLFLCPVLKILAIRNMLPWRFEEFVVSFWVQF